VTVGNFSTREKSEHNSDLPAKGVGKSKNVSSTTENSSLSSYSSAVGSGPESVSNLVCVSQSLASSSARFRCWDRDVVELSPSPKQQ
jgi:hypothetical protein